MDHIHPHGGCLAYRGRAERNGQRAARAVPAAHYSCMQITRARSTRTLKFLQESQFEICMHALRIRYCCCHCCSNVDLRLGEAISVESMHGWSHDARILMADGGCVH